MGGSREVVGLHTTCQPPIAQFAIYRARCLKIDKKLKLLQLPRLSFSPQLCTEWLRRSCFARENKIFSAARNDKKRKKQGERRKFNVSPRETEKIMESVDQWWSMSYLQRRSIVRCLQNILSSQAWLQGQHILRNQRQSIPKFLWGC